MVAEGTFQELQQQSSGSLEQLFAQLTGSDTQTGVAEEFIHTINQ